MNFDGPPLVGAPIVFALLMAAGTASADDHIVEGGQPSDRGSGTIQPLEVTRVRLSSEVVRLKFRNEGAYQLTAEYRLENPGPARSIRFGVPTSWRRYEFPGEPPHAPDEIRDGAQNIEIVIAGQRVSCAPALADAALRAAAPADLGKSTTSSTQPYDAQCKGLGFKQ